MTTQHSPNPGSPALDPKIPPGPIQDRWDDHKFSVKLVNPANKRKYDIIVIGTGLAGASAAASFGELGYNVKVFTHNDSARRGHSIAARPSSSDRTSAGQIAAHCPHCLQLSSSMLT